MSNESSVSPLRQAVMKWDVIEQDSLGNRWVIAQFNDEDHAGFFAFHANGGWAVSDGKSYTVRENPEWVRTRVEYEPRELHRPVDVTETIEEQTA